MMRRKKFSLLQIQNIFVYFAGGQKVSGHFSISHQRCCWATVSLISQQPRPVQYFVSNPIICEASQQSFENINPKKKKKKTHTHTHTHTLQGLPKKLKKFGRNLERVQWKKLSSFLCVVRSFVSFLSS